MIVPGARTSGRHAVSLRLLRLVLVAFVLTLSVVAFASAGLAHDPANMAPLPHQVTSSSSGPCVQSANCGGAGSLVPAGQTLGIGLLAVLGVGIVPRIMGWTGRRRRFMASRLARGVFLDIAHPPRNVLVAR
jgi:hypothetical protein